MCEKPLRSLFSLAARRLREAILERDYWAGVRMKDNATYTPRTKLSDFLIDVYAEVSANINKAEGPLPFCKTLAEIIADVKAISGFSSGDTFDEKRNKIKQVIIALCFWHETLIEGQDKIKEIVTMLSNEQDIEQLIKHVKKHPKDKLMLQMLINLLSAAGRQIEASKYISMLGDLSFQDSPYAHCHKGNLEGGKK